MVTVPYVLKGLKLNRSTSKGPQVKNNIPSVWPKSFNFVTQIRMPKNIGNFTPLLKPNNIGTHLKSMEISFQVVHVHLFLISITFFNFLKIPSVFKGLMIQLWSASVTPLWTPSH
jgi:hypothetical protein